MIVTIKGAKSDQRLDLDDNRVGVVFLEKGRDDELFYDGRPFLTFELIDHVGVDIERFFRDYGGRLFHADFSITHKPNSASLLVEAERLNTLAYQVQNDETLNDEQRIKKLDELRRMYRAWYLDGLAAVSALDTDSIKVFRRMYAGRWYEFGIEKYLEAALKKSTIGRKNEDGSLRWLVEHRAAFEKRIRQQCDVLAMLGSGEKWLT